MAYEYITKYTAKNYTPASQVPGVFGLPPKKRWITVHHWGAMESGYRPARFYEIAGYLASANARQVSAHYVVERGKIACLINPADASWANGHAQGNAQSISIECNPLCSREDQETLAELVAELRATYGELVIVPHSYWTPTECPGRYNVFEIDRMALAIERGHGAVAPVADDKKPIKEKEWFEMPLDNRAKDDIRDILKEFLGDTYDVPGNQGTAKNRENNPTWTAENAFQNVWGGVNHIVKDVNRILELVQSLPDAVLDAPVKLEGDTEGTTTLRKKVAWQAHEFHRNTEAVEALTDALDEPDGHPDEPYGA